MLGAYHFGGLTSGLFFFLFYHGNGRKTNIVHATPTVSRIYWEAEFNMSKATDIPLFLEINEKVNINDFIDFLV